MELEYAGFWRRLGAHLVDNIIILFLMGILTIVFKSQILVLISIVLYYAWLEGSKKQGTLGKMAIQISVTDLNGKRVAYWRALLRVVAMLGIPMLGTTVFLVILSRAHIISDLYFWNLMLNFLFLLLSCLMIFFTPRQQALHDLVTGCLVLKGKPEEIESKLQIMADRSLSGLDDRQTIMVDGAGESEPNLSGLPE